MSGFAAADIRELQSSAIAAFDAADINALLPSAIRRFDAAEIGALHTTEIAAIAIPITKRTILISSHVSASLLRFSISACFFASLAS